jgi:hypothetical protein
VSKTRVRLHHRGKRAQQARVSRFRKRKPKREHFTLWRKRARQGLVFLERESQRESTSSFIERENKARVNLLRQRKPKREHFILH